jgi:uncharacterized DUF497 family protein
VVDWGRFVPSDFEYDEQADHLGPHGVTLDEATECFYNEHTVRRNKGFVDRWQLIGTTDAGRKLKVIFELKPKRVVRIVTGWPV